MKTWTGQLNVGDQDKIAIVAARFNGMITEKLLEGAKDAFLRNGGSEENLEIIWVPGAFEIPFASQKLAKLNRFSAIVCLGAVIRGETSHYDYVCSEVSKGISKVSLDYNIPVMFGVLTTDSVEQALNRAGIKAGNKGFECMMGAIEMVGLSRQLES